MNTIRQAEAVMPLSRPRPPLFMFTIVWPIRAHPASDPNSAHVQFAMPCAMHSMWVEERVSVSSSTSCCARRESTSPTTHTAAANGMMIWRVSNVNGHMGNAKAGREPLMETMSPTVRRAPTWPHALSTGSELAMPVTIPMAASGAGMERVTSGITCTKNMVRPTRPNMQERAGPESQAKPPPAAGIWKATSWERKMAMARPFTKPSITGCGTRRMNFPSREKPHAICIRPASKHVGNRYW
mmetsp:Transcript_29/g.68  ORF Transcript_29/g.68 Transcript_29/m.68 type:complete len:241 (-) Transcript_29:80-802(-)